MKFAIKMFGVAAAALMMCVGVYAQDNNDAGQNRDANEEHVGNDQNHDGPRRLGPGGPTGGHRWDDRHDKSGDTVLQALIAEVVPKFQQLVYTDDETGKTMEYNIFVPENYDPSQTYPLLLFIGDASTAHQDVKVPLIQGYGGIIWASEAEQAKHPSFVVVPQYKTVTVNDEFEMSYEVEMTIRLIKHLCGQYSIDTKRLYTTGQSMGGMMSMCFNIYHPKFFAATLYAGCQWDTSLMAGFADDHFIYGVGGGDEKAHGGMDSLREVLEGNGKHISSAEWSAKLPAEEQEENMKALLAEGNNVNFFVFTKGTVMPESGVGIEHMWSFDYIYRIEAARDWIFAQHLDAEPSWANEKVETPDAKVEEHPMENHGEGENHEANEDHPWKNHEGEANEDHPWHKDGEHHGPHGGPDPRHDKSGDAVLQALLAETVDKFQQLVYDDAETGKTLEYNLFIPENYDSTQTYPLMLFIGDASTARQDVLVPLKQGYGGVIWASAAEQAKHPCFVVVPQYPTVPVDDYGHAGEECDMTIRLIQYLCGQYSVDTTRLYTTGQSMGGMMSMYFNISHPKFFAASLYAGCQWIVSTMAGFANDSFIYGVAGGDVRASAEQQHLREFLESNGKHVSFTEWSAQLPAEEQEANMKALLDEGNNVNFFVFTKGSVMPESGVGMEHMWSFDYVYKLEAARDWIFAQHLDNENPESDGDIEQEEHETEVSDHPEDPQDGHMGPGGPDGPRDGHMGPGGPDGPRGPHDGHRGPGGPGGGVMDKSGDAFLQTLIAENLDKFQQLVYTDAETGETVEYNLFIPKDYDSTQTYPLMLFVADASTVGKDVKVPLTQGYGGLIWVTDSEQAKHPCFVVVPQYKNVTVAGDGAVLTLNLVKSVCEQYSIDTKRLYTTGQSMGGMMSMYINATYPKFFAAALYAGCQWDVSVLAGFANDYFIYGVGGGDERAHGGMEELYALLEGNGKHVSRAEWNAKLPLEEQEENMKALLAEGNNVNFFVFTTGSVMPEDGSGMEHMWSFDYVYRIEAARDWIFEQHLD